MEGKDITFIGYTTFRNQRKKFGVKRDDRRRHFYTIGKTGMGKTNLMENMAIQDIQNGNGLAFVDPHGEAAEGLLNHVPANRIQDVIYFNPADLDYPIAFNVMEKVDFRYRHLVAGGLMGVFKKVWPDVWSARMEYILNNAILALLEYPDSTLLGINRMLSDPEFRETVVEKVKDPIVKAFWVTEYARYTQRYEIEATAAIQNKVGQFVSNALIRNVVGQTKSTINMRRIMDEGKILILDLSKGRIGEDNSRLLGALLVTKLQLAAMSRVDIPEDERKDFYLYVDEFQNFATESFASILSEARKYRLCLIMGHQYITQMDEIVRDAVFGNVGSMAVFRIGAEDAEFLEKEFMPEFTAEDLVNLTKYHIYIKLMIDGIASHPFSAETLAPPKPIEDSNKGKIIAASRERYGIRSEIVEEKILRWTGVLDNQDKPPAPRDGKKSGPRPSMSAPPRAQDGPVTLYDAICALCGKATKVIFKPEKGVPVYCKSCLKKIRKSPEPSEKPEAPRDVSGERGSPEEGKIENIPFGPSRRGAGEDLKPKKRKEINLADLKKAIEESLETKEKEEKEKAAPAEEEVMLPDQSLPQNEQMFPPASDERPASEDQKKKGIINPGEKVNL